MDIPRIHKETVVFDPENTIEGNVSEAGTKATDYVTDITGGGIMVHPSDDSTSGWKISSAIELLKSGVSHVKLWLDGSVSKLRLGRADKGHVVIDDSGLDVLGQGGSASVAKFGETARIGLANSGHSTVDNYGLSVYSDSGTLAAKFARAGVVVPMETPASETLEPGLVFVNAWQAMTAPDITFYKVATLSGGTYREISYGSDDGSGLYYVKKKSGGTVSIKAFNLSSSTVTLYYGPMQGAGDAEAYVGDPAKAHAHVDYRGMKMVDKDGKGFFNVIDLRDSSGEAKITDTFAYNSTRQFVLSFAVKSVVSVTVDGTAIDASRYGVQQFVYTVGGLSYLTSKLTLAQNVSGSTVVCTYKTASDAAKTLTFGTRASGNVGGHSVSLGLLSSSRSLASVAEGVGTVASGWGSHAEGADAHASGFASHAEGVSTDASGWGAHASGYGTVAASESQVAIGTFNVEDHSNVYALIIGNGEDGANRSNAMAVSRTGAVNIAGALTQNSDRRLKEHRSHLDDIGPELVRSLKPALYEKDGSPHYGFYAQDVAEADKFDALVGEEASGYLTLDYQGIIAPLVAYCQHLEKHIEALEGGE